MKIQFTKGDLTGKTRDGDRKYLETLVKHGFAIEVKEEKGEPETKELKHEPKTKQRVSRKRKT